MRLRILFELRLKHAWLAPESRWERCNFLLIHHLFVVLNNNLLILRIFLLLDRLINRRLVQVRQIIGLLVTLTWSLGENLVGLMVILFIACVEKDSLLLVFVALHVLSWLLLNLLVLAVVLQHIYVISLLLVLGDRDLLVRVNLCLRGHESVVCLALWLKLLFWVNLLLLFVYQFISDCLRIDTRVNELLLSHLGLRTFQMGNVDHFISLNVMGGLMLLHSRLIWPTLERASGFQRRIILNHWLSVLLFSDWVRFS